MNTDQDGKRRADNARMQDVAQVGKKLGRNPFKIRRKSKFAASALGLAVLIALGSLFLVRVSGVLGSFGSQYSYNHIRYYRKKSHSFGTLLFAYGDTNR